MSAVLVEIADAVTDLLNAAAFETYVTDLEIADEWEAERSWADWDLELKDAGELLVDVVPVTHDRSELETRGSIVYESSIDIGCRKKFHTADETIETGRVDAGEVDRFVWLVEKIHEYFCKDRFADYQDAVWDSTKIVVACDRKMLKQNRQFFGAVRLTFKTSKALT